SLRRSKAERNECRRALSVLLWNGLYARSQQSQLHEVAAIQRQFSHLLLSHQKSDRAAAGIDRRNFCRDFHGFRNLADRQHEVDDGGFSNGQYKRTTDTGLESFL